MSMQVDTHLPREALPRVQPVDYPVVAAEKGRRETDARHQLNELARGITFYRRLGLDFEKISDERLRLVFTAIDASDPERPFSFSMRVTDTDAYEVDDCEPRVAELPALLRALNENNDFSRFVQGMRRAFKESAAL